MARKSVVHGGARRVTHMLKRKHPNPRLRCCRRAMGHASRGVERYAAMLCRCAQRHVAINAMARRPRCRVSKPSRQDPLAGGAAEWRETDHASRLPRHANQPVLHVVIHSVRCRRHVHSPLGEKARYAQVQRRAQKDMHEQLYARCPRAPLFAFARLRRCRQRRFLAFSSHCFASPDASFIATLIVIFSRRV